MISLWKTANDLDRLADLQRVIADSYALALAASAQYAVEFDRGDVAEFRAHLQTLEELWRAASTPENLQNVAASFRGELREYQDKAHKRLAELRREVKAAADAMKVFADGVASNEADHEQQLEGEIKRLQTLTQTDNLDTIHRGIQSATNVIVSSVDQMRRSNQLVIAQMRDEIRLLHHEIQAERRSLHSDRVSGAWNRQKLETHLTELLSRDEPFCLLVVAIPSLKPLERRHSQALIAGALKAFIVRLQKTLGGEAMIGRWSEDEFVSILPMEVSNLMALSREVTRKLSGKYTVQENGLAHEVAFEVRTGLVDRRAGDDGAKFWKKLEQIAQALTGS